MASLLPRRFGRFFIAGPFFRDLDQIEAFGLFAKVFPVSALHNYAQDRIEYVAYSKHFREVPDNQAAPYYNVVVTKTVADCPICGKPAWDHSHVDDGPNDVTTAETREQLRSNAAAQPPTYSFEFVEVEAEKCDVLAPWW